jgi:hypothetical protein
MVLSSKGLETVDLCLCAAGSYVAQHFQEMISKLDATGGGSPVTSWLGHPFGNGTIESWLRGRYPVGLRFHTEGLAAGS